MAAAALGSGRCGRHTRAGNLSSEVTRRYSVDSGLLRRTLMGTPRHARVSRRREVESRALVQAPRPCARTNARRGALPTAFWAGSQKNLTGTRDSAFKSQNRKTATLLSTYFRNCLSELRLRNPMSTRSTASFAFLKVHNLLNDKKYLFLIITPVA